MKLRVWWIGQLGTKPFYRPVGTLREARTLLDALAFYDLHQLAENIRGDFSNAGGLDAFDPEDDADSPEGSWSSWYGDGGQEIEDLSDEEIAEIDAELGATS